ncbi:MAG: GntR family transcriptional regulator [Anaerolineales bacterium]
MPPTDSDQAYRLLKDRIVTIEMRPGTVIREADLMADLNLGRTPIREALKRLEAEDFVVAMPHRGSQVADIRITDLTQIFEVRVELEGLSARLAAERIQTQELAQLEGLADEYQTIQQVDLGRLFGLDRSFHKALARAGRNRFLFREIDRYYDLSLRIWYLAMDYVQASDVNVEAHLETLASIQAGDVDGAERAMREHIRQFHASIKEYL